MHSRIFMLKQAETFFFPTAGSSFYITLRSNLLVLSIFETMAKTLIQVTI